MTEREPRYEISTTIGPCSEDAAFALADAIMELPEAKVVSLGGVTVSVIVSGDND